MSNLMISVILGSTREGRYGDKPAHWSLGKLADRDGVDAQLLEVRDYPLPMFDRPRPPSSSRPARVWWARALRRARDEQRGS